MGIYYVAGVPYSSDYLMHFGIKGQRWGIRRFQNEDGTLNAAGKERYRSLKYDYDASKNDYNKKKSEYESAVNARNTYKAYKKDRQLRRTIEFERSKNIYKENGKNKGIKKMKLNTQQAEWKKNRLENELNKIKGLPLKKVSVLSPKLIHYGKKAIKKTLASALIMGTGATALAGASVAVGANMVIGNISLTDLLSL